MEVYATFFQGAVIFFIVGVWTSYLDILFQDEFTDNKRAGRGFWTTISLTAIAVAAILLVHYFFVNVKNGGTKASKQFINIHPHETRDIEMGGGDI